MSVAAGYAVQLTVVNICVYISAKDYRRNKQLNNMENKPVNDYRVT